MMIISHKFCWFHHVHSKYSNFDITFKEIPSDTSTSRGPPDKRGESLVRKTYLLTGGMNDSIL